MFALPSFLSRKTHLLVITIGMAISGAAFAQNNETQAPAQQLPPPNPAAEKALEQHFQSIFSALEGRSAVPDSKAFTEEFNQNASKEQIQQVFTQVHQTVGSCRIAGQLKAPVSFVRSYLLQCEKGFVPIDIAVEEKAPYRVQSLLIRPGYAKL